MAWNDDQSEAHSHYHEPGFPSIVLGRDYFDCFNTSDSGLTTHTEVAVPYNTINGAINVVALVSMTGL